MGLLSHTILLPANAPHFLDFFEVIIEFIKISFQVSSCTFSYSCNAVDFQLLFVGALFFPVLACVP